MPGRNLSTVCQVLLTLSVLLLGADQAMAYVGPGADVTFIGYAMTLLAWVLAAFGVLQLGLLPGDYGHSLCGPWG